MGWCCKSEVVRSFSCPGCEIPYLETEKKSFVRVWQVIIQECNVSQNVQVKGLALAKEHRIEGLKASLGLMVRFLQETIHILENYKCFTAGSGCMWRENSLFAEVSLNLWQRCLHIVYETDNADQTPLFFFKCPLDCGSLQHEADCQSLLFLLVVVDLFVINPTFRSFSVIQLTKFIRISLAVR
jgi:hypothetical protein